MWNTKNKIINVNVMIFHLGTTLKIEKDFWDKILRFWEIGMYIVNNYKDFLIGNFYKMTWRPYLE